MKQTQKATLLVTLSNVIYGCSFLATTVALRESGSATYGIVAMRFFVAFVVLSLLLAFRVIHVDYRSKNVWKLLPAALIYPGLYFICETLALGCASSAMVGVTIGAAPVFVALFSWVFLKKRQSPLQMLCILGSIAGVLLLNVEGISGQALSLKAVVTLLGAVVTMSVYNVMVNRAGDQFTPTEITYFMVTVGMVLFALVDLIARGPFAAFRDCASSSYLTAVLFLGVFTSAGASFALNSGLCYLTAVKVAVLNNVTSVVSILCGVLVLHEQFTVYGVLGCALVLAGCIGYSVIKSDS